MQMVRERRAGLRDWCNGSAAGHRLLAAALLAVLLAVPSAVQADPESGDLRLVDGDSPNEGRLEVFLNDQWGTVCDDFFGQPDATVACRQVGYTGATAIGDANGSGPIWLDNVECTGTESRLIDCEHHTGPNCYHYEDVHLTCSTTEYTEVTIAAAAASVTEGTAARFTLTRSGATATQLTVTVAVTETGAMIEGTAPTTAAFAAGATVTTLSVATADDLAEEPDSDVTATVDDRNSVLSYVAASPDSGTVTVVDDEVPDDDHVRSAAHDLGTLAPADGAASYTDAVNGVSDKADYYVFKLAQPGRVTLALSGQEHDANLYLEHANGTVLYSSATAGTANESLNQLLAAGDWYVRVAAAEAGINTYVLGYDVTALTASEMLSMNAALTGLTLSGVDIGTFAAGTVDYNASVAYEVAQTTVTATVPTGVVFSIAPEDADSASGHQVLLPSGAETVVTVVVTAADGITTRTYTVRITRPPPPQPVTGFTLVNATGRAPDPDVSAIAAGAELDLSSPRATWFAIRADVRDDVPVRRVELRLSGTKTVERKESSAPYALHGDDGAGDYAGFNLPNGTYEITATAYPAGDGVAFEAQTRSFTVSGSYDANAAPVTGFTLVNTTGSTPNPDVEITEGAELELSQNTTDRYYIRADVDASIRVGRMLLKLTGPRFGTQYDSVAPYSIFGEYTGRTLPPGSYRITATPYVESTSLRGDVLTGLSRTFTVAGEVVLPEDNPGNDGDLRLRDGAAAHEGRLEVFLNGKWGTVCDDFFDTDDAEVACRQLGYDAAISIGDADGYGPIWMDNLQCTGSEDRLVDCEYHDSPNCWHVEDVYLTCAAAVMQQGTVGEENDEPAAPPTVTGFTLVNAAGSPDADVAAIGDGAEVDLAPTAADRYSIRAEVQNQAAVGSVHLELTGPVAAERTENDAPYALYGDDGAGDYAGAVLPSGDYRITATLYAEADGGGALLTAVSRPFTVVGGNLLASFTDLPEAHGGPGGAWFTFRVLFTESPRVGYQVLRDESFAVEDGTVRRARRVNGRNDLREIHVQPTTDEAVTVTLAGGRACTASGAICTADGRRLANTVTVTIPGPVALSAADAQATEAAGAVIGFPVTLDRAADETVTVDYTTADGTATAGADYTAVSGTLTFAVGDTERTVAVTVLDDAADEGAETFLLRLSNAAGARLADAEATGTISNRDPLPRAWLARFGRTAAGHVLEAVEERLSGAGAAEWQVTVAGRRLSVAAAGFAEQWAAYEQRWAQRLQQGRLWDEPVSMGLPALLANSSFALAAGAADAGTPEDGRWALWGRGAWSRFAGSEGELTLDGEVLTGTVGADYERQRLLAGLAVAYSTGAGTYDDGAADSGELRTALLGVHPVPAAEAA